MDRVLARDASLDPRDPDALADMLSPDERHFLPAEPVAVRDVEKQPIPSVHMRNGCEKPFDFHLREVGKLVRPLAPDDVHFVSLSYVGRDLDAFTHFDELNSGHRTRLRGRAEVLMKRLALFAVVALLPASAWASDLPRLFTRLPEAPSRFARPSTADENPSNTRVQMDTDVLALSDFVVDMPSGANVASRVDQYRRSDGETFIFRVGSDALSVFTTFYGRPALGHIVVDGELYFVAPEGDHYVIAPSTTRDLPEHCVQVASPTAAGLSARRRRSVRHPGPPDPKYRAYLAGILTTAYRDAVGNEQAARDRMQHTVDFTNAALMTSGYVDGRFYLRDIAVMDIGNVQTREEAIDWAWNNPDLEALRAKKKAFGTFIAIQHGAGSAPRNANSPINPKYQYILVGGFFASWDDGDIITGAHELGHSAGMDHNVEAAAPVATDPIPFARGAYDCSAAVRDIMCYNPCGTALRRAPTYSSPTTVWNGIQLGSEVLNNRRAAELVFPYIAGDHD